MFPLTFNYLSLPSYKSFTVKLNKSYNRFFSKYQSERCKPSLVLVISLPAFQYFITKRSYRKHAAIGATKMWNMHSIRIDSASFWSLFGRGLRPALFRPCLPPVAAIYFEIILSASKISVDYWLVFVHFNWAAICRPPAQIHITICSVAG